MLPSGVFAPIYENVNRYPIALRMVAVTGGPGYVFNGPLRLSISSRRFDEIARVTYERPSETIWLPPGETLLGVYDAALFDEPRAAAKALFFDPSVIARAMRLNDEWSRVGELLVLRLMTAGNNLPVTSIGPTVSLAAYFPASGGA